MKVWATTTRQWLPPCHSGCPRTWSCGCQTRSVCSWSHSFRSTGAAAGSWAHGQPGIGSLGHRERGWPVAAPSSQIWPTWWPWISMQPGRQVQSQAVSEGCYSCTLSPQSQDEVCTPIGALTWGHPWSSKPEHLLAQDWVGYRRHSPADSWSLTPNTSCTTATSWVTISL